MRFHDDMDLEEIGDDLEIAPDTGLSSTEIGKQNAVDQKEAPEVDEAIFEVFLEESVEVLEEANAQYALCLEDSSDRTATRELRRAFHTLKGSARMVGLNDAGEVAWFTESLFNYVLDTEKPLSPGILSFARESLDEFEKQVDEKYANQHLIDTAAWGEKTERVNLDVDESESEAVEESESEASSVEQAELNLNSKSLKLMIAWLTRLQLPLHWSQRRFSVHHCWMMIHLPKSH